MSELELDDIKLKTPDEMSDEEKDFLRENKDELTDGDRKDYKEILDEEPEKEPKKEPKKEPEKEPEKPAHSFKSDDELDDYYKDRQEKEKVERKRAKTDSKRQKGEYFAKDYKPTDWNQYTKDMLKIIREDRNVSNQQQRKLIADVNERIDKETEELRDLVPDIPAAGTKARRDFDRNIAEVMIGDSKIRTVAKAYKTMLSEKKTEAKKKKKDLAKKVGGGAGTTEQKKGTKYKKFASRDLDDAGEAALDAFEKLS